MTKEAILCEQIANYLNYKYPDVLYHFDYGSGVKLTMGQAVKQKRLNKRSWPDLFIAVSNQTYAGLFIEIKAVSPFLKDGITLKQNEHLKEQNKTLHFLNKAGYCGVFGVHYDGVIKIIDEYMEMK